MVTRMAEDKKYAFLMVEYGVPDIIREIQESIDESELYGDPERPDDFGLELMPHVTLAACLDNDTDTGRLFGMLRPLHDYRAMLTNVSIFDNELYDVLKCDVASDILHASNSEILSVYPSHSEFKEYHPHMTVAYLNKGASKRHLIDMLTPLVLIDPVSFVYSNWTDGGKTQKTIKFS